MLSFVDVASQVNDVPIGRKRELWDRDALAIKDRKFGDYKSRIKDEMLGTCGTVEAVEALLIADLTGAYS